MNCAAINHKWHNSANKMSVAAGDRHTLVAVAGRVMSCGRGDFGQLGSGARADRLVLAPVKGLDALLAPGARVTVLAAGKFTSACCTSDGDVLTFGAGSQGQLGDGGRADRAEPVKLRRSVFGGE